MHKAIAVTPDVEESAKPEGIVQTQGIVLPPRKRGRPKKTSTADLEKSAEPLSCVSLS
jgi:hypothetical protein